MCGCALVIMMQGVGLGLGSRRRGRGRKPEGRGAERLRGGPRGAGAASALGGTCCPNGLDIAGMRLAVRVEAVYIVGGLVWRGMGLLGASGPAGTGKTSPRGASNAGPGKHLRGLIGRAGFSGVVALFGAREYQAAADGALRFVPPLWS